LALLGLFNHETFAGPYNAGHIQEVEGKNRIKEHLGIHLWFPITLDPAINDLQVFNLDRETRALADSSAPLGLLLSPHGHVTKSLNLARPYFYADKGVFHPRIRLLDGEFRERFRHGHIRREYKEVWLFPIKPDLFQSTKVKFLKARITGGKFSRTSVSAYLPIGSGLPYGSG